MSTVFSSLVHGDQGLRCTFECGGVASLVEHVEERRSLARPPELWVDVTVGPGQVPALAREPAALLVESESGSRYVQGWVRGVERYADVRLGARVRILLVPTTLVGDAGAQAGAEAVEPEYVYDPASWAAGVEGEGEEDTQRFAREELAAALGREREQTIVLDGGEPEAPQVTGTGTELLRREDILRMMIEGVAAPVGPAPPLPIAVQEQTERVAKEHVAEMRRAAIAKIGADEPRPPVDADGCAGEGTERWSASDLEELRRRWEERSRSS